MKNVLLMGTNGRIGGNLYEELKGDFNLFAFSSPNQINNEMDITFLKKDLFILPEVEEALKGIDTVLFFEDPIMRLNRQTQGRFEDFYILIADNIARAAQLHEVEQIIFIADEVSDPYIVEVLAAFGAKVRVTQTPIKRYGKTLSYKTTDYNSVRSVQRARLPRGWNIEDVGKYYFDWLDNILYGLINIRYEKQTINMYLPKKARPILVIEYDAKSSYNGLEIYRIKGGSLSKKLMNKTPRFEFRALPGGEDFLMALHDFEPKLSWGIYQIVQAPLYTLINRIYQVEMIINNQAPGSHNRPNLER
ncbi:hypothetical protein ACFPFV_03705 [Salinicoccus siamensis]|uniref:Uncharacterized protein n=1 Tax=Salinicoccus siamensis TaxID=381830 RepID=A0ABV5Z0B6_9STAP